MQCAVVSSKPNTTVHCRRETERVRVSCMMCGIMALTTSFCVCLLMVHGCVMWCGVTSSC